jgi:multidrug resistance protein, MATE family
MGIYLAFKQDMKLSGLWVGLTTALVLVSVIGGLIVLRADWDYEVKKVMERLENETNLGNDDGSAESV